MRQLELHLLAALCCAAWIAGGLAIATNYRGFTAWHARWSVGMFQQPTEERVAWQTGLERSIGAAFATAGVIALIATMFAHFHAS